MLGRFWGRAFVVRNCGDSRRGNAAEEVSGVFADAANGVVPVLVEFMDGAEERRIPIFDANAGAGWKRRGVIEVEEVFIVILGLRRWGFWDWTGSAARAGSGWSVDGWGRKRRGRRRRRRWGAGDELSGDEDRNLWQWGWRRRWYRLRLHPLTDVVEEEVVELIVIVTVVGFNAALVHHDLQGNSDGFEVAMVRVPVATVDALDQPLIECSAIRAVVLEGDAVVMK